MDDNVRGFSVRYINFFRLVASVRAVWWRGFGLGMVTLVMLAVYSPRVAAAGIPEMDATYTISGLPMADEAQAMAENADAPVGLVIVATDAAGPAALAGIQRGDILLQVDDVEIDAAATLYAEMQSAAPGDVVTVVVQHGDEERTLEVTLGEVEGRAYLGVQVVDTAVANTHTVAVPAQAEAAIAVTEVMTVAATEVEATEAGAADEAMFVGVGLMVAEVMADAPAAQAGLQAGDLLLTLEGMPVARPEDLLNVLAAYAPGDTVTLTVQRGGLVGAVIEELTVTLGAAPDDAARAYLGVRVAALPPAVNFHIMPPTGPFTAPALPALPEVAPGYAPRYAPGHAYGYAYPALPPMGRVGDADVCGAGGVTIEQHFYAMPGFAPSVAPVAPQSFAQPAVPATRVFIDETGRVHDVEATASAGVTAHNVTVRRVADPTLDAQMERNVVVMREGDAATWTMALPAMPAVAGVTVEAVEAEAAIETTGWY